jgi:cysteinyl-tRNA synthetase
LGEDKADPLDFALWKGTKPGEPAWDSPWGSGRPGWHIECSAMSLKYLGAGFDIHGGGRDLNCPHHENELAQAEGALGETFVRFWMHNGMLNLRDEKMSKSVGNTLTLRATLERHRPEVLIAAFLGSHYRSPLEFSDELLDDTAQQVERLRNVFRRLQDYTPSTGSKGDEKLIGFLTQRREAFAAALADDLNTAAALAEIFGLAREVNTALAKGNVSAPTASQVREEMTEMARVLGLEAVTAEEATIPSDVDAMAKERQKARAGRDFARADVLRAQIQARGFEVRDVADGYKLVPLG